MEAMSKVDAFDAVDTLDAVDVLHVEDILDAVDTSDAVYTFDALDTLGAVEVVDAVGTTLEMGDGQGHIHMGLESDAWYMKKIDITRSNEYRSSGTGCHRRMLLCAKIFLCAAMVVALVALSGCEASRDTDRVKVYFENTNATKLVTVDYHPIAIDDLDKVLELFDYMQNAGRSDTIAAVPASFKLSYAEINQNTLTLDLKGSYDDMPSNSKLLMAAALTKTMTQLDSVTYLLLKVNGQMAKDAGGDEYGILRSALFVDVAADDPNNFINSNMTLYYSNMAGDRLVREDVSVIYRRGTSLERTVVEQLIRGPQMGSGNVKRTLPSTVSVLTIAVTDRICYVNLSQDLQYESLGVFNYIPIYSIVDSLVSLNTVDKVQILINGSVLTTDLGDKVSVSTPLEPNYSYVDGAMR